MGGLTCFTCQVGFSDPELHRNHFKGDWHRYNLKRKVANLPSVTADEFQARKASHEPKADDKKDKEKPYCFACRKKFTNVKSYENHLNSKKHKEMVIKVTPEELEAFKEKAAKKLKVEDVDMKEEEPVAGKSGDNGNDEEEMEEVDSDEWEDYEDDPLPVTRCLFCVKEFKTLEINAKHMLEAHSFFLPDLEYITDLTGLMEYLGAKVGQGLMCLWCSEKSKMFKKLEDVQKHMVDSGHTKMKHEGESLLEYADFYDYSSSYPDGGEDVHKDSEVNFDELDDSGFFLTLPSGATIGHRSLVRYFKQSINPNREVVIAKSSSRHGGSTNQVQLLSTYRVMGLSGTNKVEVAKKARDIKFMHKQIQRRQLALGKQNNFSKRMHFRDRNAGLE